MELGSSLQMVTPSLSSARVERCRCRAACNMTFGSRASHGRAGCRHYAWRQTLPELENITLPSGLQVWGQLTDVQCIHASECAFAAVFVSCISWTHQRIQLGPVKRYAAGTACNMEEASSTKIWGRLQHSAPARWGIDEQRADMTLPLFDREGGVSRRRAVGR